MSPQSEGIVDLNLGIPALRLRAYVDLSSWEMRVKGDLTDFGGQDPETIKILSAGLAATTVRVFMRACIAVTL
jgi:hypothetical protein